MQQPQLNQIDLRELGNQDEKAFLNWIEDWKGQDLFWATFAWEPGISHKEHLQKLEGHLGHSSIGFCLKPLRAHLQYGSYFYADAYWNNCR